MAPCAAFCHGLLCLRARDWFKSQFNRTLAVLYSCRTPPDVMSTYQASADGKESFSTSTNTKYLSFQYVSEEDDGRKSRKRKGQEEMLSSSYEKWLFTCKLLAKLHSWCSWDLCWAGWCEIFPFLILDLTNSCLPSWSDIKEMVCIKQEIPRPKQSSRYEIYSSASLLWGLP